VRFLAKMALSRVPGLIVHDQPKDVVSDMPYDFVVVGDRGLCFFVEIAAFSSVHRKMNGVGTDPVIRWDSNANLIRRARRSQNPIFLFLFDADTEHGRYQRLDTLPEPAADAATVSVSFPLSQTIDKTRLEAVVNELESEQRV
jgi:hypothetical protein